MSTPDMNVPHYVDESSRERWAQCVRTAEAISRASEPDGVANQAMSWTMTRSIFGNPSLSLKELRDAELAYRRFAKTGASQPGDGWRRFGARIFGRHRSPLL